MGGGFGNINHTLQSMNEAYLAFPGANGYMPWAYYVSNIVLWSFFTMGQPHLFTKFFAMKDHKTMFKAILLGTAGMFFSATLIEWTGVNGIATIQNIEKADQIVPMILQRGLNPFLASIFIAGIVAAGMSTIDGILVTKTGAVTRDIYQKLINKKATDESVMKLSKVVTILIDIIVICFGVFQPGSIFEINLFAFSENGNFCSADSIWYLLEESNCTRSDCSGSSRCNITVTLHVESNYKSICVWIPCIVPDNNHFINCNGCCKQIHKNTTARNN